MKFHRRLASLVLAPLRQALRSVQQCTRVEPSQASWTFAPVPVRADRPTRQPARRVPCRGG